MKVVVRMQAQVRQAAGTPSVTIEVPSGSTVEAVVRTLAAKQGEGLRRLLLTATGVQPTLLLFRGDQQVGPDETLDEGDELTLLAPMAGG